MYCTYTFTAKGENSFALLDSFINLSFTRVHSFLCSSDELYAYLTHCRPDLCILEGGEEEGEADRDEEEFVLIEDKDEVEQEEEEEEEEVCHKLRSSGEDWEVSGFGLLPLGSKQDQTFHRCTFSGYLKILFILFYLIIPCADGVDGRQQGQTKPGPRQGPWRSQ